MPLGEFLHGQHTMDWSSAVIVHQGNCLLRQSEELVQTPEESPKLPWTDSAVHRKGRINPCKDVFVLTSLYRAADPEWRAIKHSDAHAGHEKAQSVLGLVPKRSSNDYKTKTDKTHHVSSKAMKVLLSPAFFLLHWSQQNWFISKFHFFFSKYLQQIQPSQRKKEEKNMWMPYPVYNCTVSLNQLFYWK